MRLITHRRTSEGYLLRVHLDERRKIKEGDPRIEEMGLEPGDPDPDWVLEHTWGPQAPETGADPKYKGPIDEAPMRRLTKDEYRAMQVTEMTGLARLELANRQALEAEQEPEHEILPTEGQKL